MVGRGARIEDKHKGCFRVFGVFSHWIVGMVAQLHIFTACYQAAELIWVIFWDGETVLSKAIKMLWVKKEKYKILEEHIGKYGLQPYGGEGFLKQVVKNRSHGEKCTE